MPDKPIVTITRRKIKRGKYNKKPRIELTERERRNYRLTYDILNGSTFDEAARLYDMKSAQATQKQFRLTVINFFLPSYKQEIINKKYNIKHLRRLWRESLL